MPPNVNVTFTATDVNFTKTLAKMRAELQTATGATIAYQTALGGLKMGALIGGASLAAMVAPALLLSKTFANFDASVRRAIAVGGPTYAHQMNQLTDAITATAVKWGISSDEIAAGVVELAKAGFDYNTVTKEMMTGVAQLAKIHQESFETISNIVTYAWSLYGSETMTAMDLMEKMNMAANISVLNIDELGSAFEYAGASAMTSGVTIDEFLASIAALSQVATKSYQNIGTLLNRLLVSGADLEKKLGVATGTFVKNGILNLSAFFKYLSEVPDRYSVIEKASELWGVRSTRVVQAMMAVPEQYVEFLNEIQNSQGNLAQQSADMGESLQSTWTKLMETLTRPVKTGTVLAEIQKAIQTLTTAVSESTLPATLRTWVEESADFLQKHGVALITTLANLAMALRDMLPSMEVFASMTANVLRVISKLPSWLFMAVGAFVMMRRFIPVTELIAFGKTIQQLRITIPGYAASLQTLTAANANVGVSERLAAQNATVLGTAFEMTGLKAQLVAQVGLFAFISGLMVLVTSRSAITKTLGAIAAGLGAIALVLAVIKGLQGNWLALGMALGAGALAVAAMASQQAELKSEFENPKLPKYQTGGKITKTGLAIVHRDEYIIPKYYAQAEPLKSSAIPAQTVNYDYRTIYIYDPSKLDLQRALAEAGKV
jgi:TP901 family phage tail tape measure protein